MQKTPKQYFFLLFWCFIALKLACQPLQLKIINSDSAKISKFLKYKQKHPSEKELLRELASVLSDLRSAGYLLAEADSFRKDGPVYTYYLNAGQKFKWALLKKGNAEMEVISHLGYHEKLYTNKAFSYGQTAKLIEKTINYYESNGFPFASIKLDSVEVKGNSISAVLRVTKNKFIKIDSIIPKGTAKVNKTFLYRYLGIKPMMPYNEDAIKGISKKLRQLPFLSESKGPVLQVTDKYTRLNLFIEKKNASQFDGIIGILPDNVTGKTVFTGDVKIRLVNNIFRAGETFDLNWRRLQTQTQDFKARVIYPYLFGTPMGIDYTIKIYRRDTSFIDVNNNFGLQYYFSGLNNIKVFYKQRNANVLSTSGLAYITSLPDYADIITKSYGIALFYEKLDYRFNPHKGISVNISSQTGNKVIKKNPKINDAAYTNLMLRSAQYQLEGDVNVFIPIKGNSVLRIASQYGSILGNAPIFRNELFRIGGLRTLRGFDEESIYASSYVIPTIEYRFLFSQNSHILLFAEGAWYENVSSNFIEDTPYSFGAGINFETKAGIFSLNYALGSQFGNPIDVRSGKIHFGLTALF